MATEQTEGKKITFSDFEEIEKRVKNIKQQIDDEITNINTLIELKKRIDLGDVPLVIGDRMSNSGSEIMNSVTFNDKKYSVYFITMINTMINDKESRITSLQNDLNNL